MIRAAITPAVRRLSLATELRDLRTLDAEVFAAGDWDRLDFIRLRIDAVREELEALERNIAQQRAHVEA